LQHFKLIRKLLGLHVKHGRCTKFVRPLQGVGRFLILAEQEQKLARQLCRPPQESHISTFCYNEINDKNTLEYQTATANSRNVSFGNLLEHMCLNNVQ